ncbi:MAG: hypothetical protein JJU33_12030 [Phycisphaerales bacterium]|nr:hypothetical protein [Phycisphaerales bacterium]
MLRRIGLVLCGVLISGAVAEPVREDSQDDIPERVQRLMGEPVEPLEEVVARLEALLPERESPEPFLMGAPGSEDGRRVHDLASSIDSAFHRVQFGHRMEHNELYNYLVEVMWGFEDRGSADPDPHARARRLALEWLELAEEEGLIASALDVQRYKHVSGSVLFFKSIPRKHYPGREFGYCARSIARLLHTYAAERIDAGDGASAADAIGATLEIAEALYGERHLGLQGVARELVTVSARLAFDALERGVLSAEDAASLLERAREPDWAGVRRNSVYSWFLWTFSCRDGLLRRWYAQDGRIEPRIAEASIHEEVDRSVLVFPMARLGGPRHANASEFGEALGEWLEAIVEEAAKPRLERDVYGVGFPLEWNGAMLPSGVESTLHRADMHDGAARLHGALRLALAIEVYRAEHGRAPERLDELVPGVLDRLPQNPWTRDGAFAYRLSEGTRLGYVLYADEGAAGTGDVILPRR